MKCEFPTPLTDDEISTILDGTAQDSVIQHWQACPSCQLRVDEARRIEAFVEDELYRFACPSSDDLGNLLFGFLDSDIAKGMQQHIQSCPRCYPEYNMLQQFLGSDLMSHVKANKAPPEKQPFIPRPLTVRVAWNELGAAALRGGLKGNQKAQTYSAQFGNTSIAIKIVVSTEDEITRIEVSGLLLEPEGKERSAKITPVNKWESAQIDLWQLGKLQSQTETNQAGEFVFPDVDSEPISLYISARDSTTLILENIPVNL